MAAHGLGLTRETACQFGSVAGHHAAFPFTDSFDRIAFEHLGQHANASGVSRNEHAQLPRDDLPEEPIGAQAVSNTVGEIR